jgi:hypothetical protein
MMPRSRHFPFLDEAEMFNDVLVRFLKAGAAPAPAMPARIREPQPVPGD